MMIQRFEMTLNSLLVMLLVAGLRIVEEPRGLLHGDLCPDRAWVIAHNECGVRALNSRVVSD